MSRISFGLLYLCVARWRGAGTVCLCARVRTRTTRHSNSFMLLLVRWRSMCWDGTQQTQHKVFLVFILCHLSLSSIISDNVFAFNQPPAPSAGIRNSNMRNFFFPPDFISHIRFFWLLFSVAHICIDVAMPLPLSYSLSSIWSVRARLPNCSTSFDFPIARESYPFHLLSVNSPMKLN